MAYRSTITATMRKIVEGPEAKLAAQRGRERASRKVLAGISFPRWYGVLRKYARRVEQHDMDAIRRSIAAGVARERGLGGCRFE